MSAELARWEMPTFRITLPDVCGCGTSRIAARRRNELEVSSNSSNSSITAITASSNSSITAVAASSNSSITAVAASSNSSITFPQI